MYSYIKGQIVDMSKDHIVVDNHGIGYLIYVSNMILLTSQKIFYTLLDTSKVLSFPF